MPYLPPCKDQPLLLGSAEEAAGGLPCGLLPAGLAESEVEAMPEALAASPFVQLELGSRYTNDQVCRMRLHVIGLLAGWLMECQRPALGDTGACKCSAR
jgi:hypothetical protein